MKQILYDTGHLTDAKWLFQRVWKFKSLTQQRSKLRRLHPTKIWKNKFVLRKRLFAGTLPANKNLFAGTLPANKNLFAGTVPANKNLFAGTPQVGSIYTFYSRNGFFDQKKWPLIMLDVQLRGYKIVFLAPHKR